MEKSENKLKTSNVQDRLLTEYSNKYSTMQTPSSRLFYVTIAILNIFLIVVAFLLLNGKEKVENITIVFENIGTQNILLLLLMFLGIMVLKTLPDYLKVFSKTKKRKFIACYCGNVKREYYDCVTIYRKGYISQVHQLSASKVKGAAAVDVVASKNIVKKCSFLIYSLIFMIIGAFLWVKYIPLYLYLIALVGVVINIFVISFVVYFGKNKEEATAFIANICKFLYNKKIIKDYEKAFYKIVDTLIEYNKGFKFNKIIIWTEIFANLLVYFLKGLAIYLLCYSLNLIEGGIFFNVLFVWVVLDAIISMWPLQKGTLIFELLFILLFRGYYLEGFIFWALLFYRVFDYFLYIIQYVVVVTIEFIIKKCHKKSTMQ